MGLRQALRAIFAACEDKPSAEKREMDLLRSHLSPMRRAQFNGHFPALPRLDHRHYLFACRLAARSLMVTGVPLLTWRASSSASQFVSLMQPCELRLLTASGSGVPWMP